MSMPNIPNITPNISLTRCETIDLLLTSIAMEEIAFSHILNAEGEKLQSILKKKSSCIEDYWKTNESVNQMLRTIIKSQLLLQMKLEDVINLDQKNNCGTCDCKDENRRKRKHSCGCCEYLDDLCTCDECVENDD